MRIKTSELTGAALDLAVAKCEGGWILSMDSFIPHHSLGRMNYSTDWSMAGPIIEREGISVLHTTMRPSHAWEASQTPQEDISVCEFGPTPLIAAMRCYVASKLGDEVDVPDELKGESK